MVGVQTALLAPIRRERDQRPEGPLSRCAPAVRLLPEVADGPLALFSCQNPACSDYARPGAGNLSVCARYGKQQRRLLYCKTCKARFSERKGTALFDSRLPEDKAAAILRHLADGHGVRKTARLVGVSK